MAVYYKFKSAKDYDSIPIAGQFISVANLKERIFESKHLGRGTDFDLMVSNAQTNEEYVDEAAMIPKNTSVLIRRVPGRPRKPIVTERDELKVVEHIVEDIPPSSTMVIGDSSAMKYPEESEWDEFGNDLYSIPEVHTAQLNAQVADISPASKVDEQSKIKALVDTPALDWSRQGQDAYGAGRGFGRVIGGRMLAGRGFGRTGGMEKKTPPAGYICHRCKVPGHFIQHCPTNGDPNYDIKRVKPPTGIPRSMLMATPDGSYALPSGAVAVLKPNEAAFEKEIEGLPSTRSITDLPPELRCPLCKEVMKDAVLTSKCCFKSFCDKCIRDYIITNSKCVCEATNLLADDLLPNKTLREAISRILETTASSTENAGSLVQVQDMESARPAPPKAPSPTLSAASKDESKHQVDQTKDARESEDAIETMADNATDVLLDKKPEKSMEATPESTNAKEEAFAEVAPIAEDAQEKLAPGEQGKKKKKRKVRSLTGVADMQWKGFQELGAENYAGMQMAPAYNPAYWAGGMPVGMDGYMPPFPGAMPYMGYAPGPFDVPFGGILPHDPYVTQGYMMPGFPQRDLAELGMNGFGMNQGPPLMSRDEFDSRKAEMRRKRDMERKDRLSDREPPREGERGGGSKEASGGADGSMVKAKSRLRSQTASAERSDRALEDRPEKPTKADRVGGPSRDSGRQASPTRAGKRWSSERERDGAAAGADVEGKTERRLQQKGSVFSRISFPAEKGEADRGNGKRRKASMDPPNGVKDVRDHDRDRDRDRPVANGYGTTSVGRRSRAGDREHDSSDEERHFKRRSSSRRESEKEKDKDKDKEREHRVQERYEGKRR
ncbi:hypothetical protein HPP92_003949 [Vanilla planifolia]|uniref:DWNN domain-containing protein n=1 Tax=Vanilla planifolia TaxID=51239 RepID=A0A835SGK9_VANPL|nr:hypothetical protein HPP92_003949 [Vanilla planifolia]